MGLEYPRSKRTPFGTRCSAQQLSCKSRMRRDREAEALYFGPSLPDSRYLEATGDESHRLLFLGTLGPWGREVQLATRECFNSRCRPQKRWHCIPGWMTSSTPIYNSTHSG